MANRIEAAVPDHRIKAEIAEPRAGGKGLDIVDGHGHAHLAPIWAFPAGRTSVLDRVVPGRGAGRQLARN